MDLHERFWSKVDVRDNNECWEWMAHKTDKGYGKFAYKSTRPAKIIRSHRVAYILYWVQDIDGLDIHHVCENPGCCNPHHLTPIEHGTHTKITHTRTDTCKSGHNWIEENIFVDKRGRRECRICKNERERQKYWADVEASREACRTRYHARKETTNV